MTKVLVAGASGAAGFEVLKLLSKKNIPVRALVRSEQSFEKVSNYTSDIFKADAREQDQLTGCCDDVEVVFSGLGKSVSLFNRNRDSFEKDFIANKNLVSESIASGVKRYVYLSIKGSNENFNLTIPAVHQKVEDYIRCSGINHTFIRPVGFYSGLNDLIAMGKKGIIPVASNGKNKTNSIHQADLAHFIFNYLFDGPEIAEVGGPEVHSRNDIARMISEKTKGRIIHLPTALINPGLFTFKFFSNNTMSKLDYFKYVTTHDMTAPKHGKITFREYLNQLDLDQLP